MKRSELREMINEELIKEGPQRQLEMYIDKTWKTLDLEDKLIALEAIKASGINQAIKLFNKTFK